jgi:agmatinase
MTVQPRSKNFLGIERKYSSYDKSEIVIASLPYERTVSYGGGTARGPRAILDASHYVEFWDEEFERELCFEKGICTLASFQAGKRNNKPAMDFYRKLITPLLDDGKFVVSLGGEHTVSIAPIAAHYQKYPDMSILHFDAHSDLRENYLGNPYSHACALARVLDFFPGERLVQVGIRAQCVEEFRLIKEKSIRTYFAAHIRNGSYGIDWQPAVVHSLQERVYVTFDVDFFDPSIMPATGTPEPGGFLWDETIQLLRRVGAEKTIIGFDVVELAPKPVFPHASYLSAKLVYKMLNAAFQNR